MYLVFAISPIKMHPEYFGAFVIYICRHTLPALALAYRHDRKICHQFKDIKRNFH